MTVPQKLTAALLQAIEHLKPENPDVALQIHHSCTVNPCHDARFGDYQSNIAMVAARALQKSPRELAQQIIAKLKVDTVCEKVEPAGPGFINFHLKREAVAEGLNATISDDVHCGILQQFQPSVVVIDFSSPNIAKAMHVGHIRSTFLGDALARIARAVGHTVITDNHLGDWGTQFGKLIHGYKHFLDAKALKESPINEFERLYKKAHNLSESNPDILATVRKELALLQAGDPENTKIWKQISDLSLAEFNKTYKRLGVTFDHYLGESFYHPMLGAVVEELKQSGIAEVSEGAICIFSRNDPELKNAAPMMIQKSDGAYLYATTDLAAARHRLSEWQANEVLYITDSRQQLHFRQLFSAVNRWLAYRKTPGTTGDVPHPRPPFLKHIIFGSILGADKKPIKTRSGEPVKLADLLDEAETRAMQIIREKNPDLSKDEQLRAARILGIGALKYADLCQNRNLDYMFDWDKLLALQGNTAPYLIYAYVRIQSIFRNAGMEPKSSSSLGLLTPEELILGKHLVQFGNTVHAVLSDYRPHLLTNHLYDLAVKFSRFYEACPVLKAEEPVRSERLTLCRLTARTLKKGLDLLGIGTLEKM